MTEAIAVFAKAALPGRVKTRLQGVLSPEEAASFYCACVEDVWASANTVAGAAVFLFTDQPWSGWDALHAYVRTRHAVSAQIRLQSDGDLGRRMRTAFEQLAGEGFDRSLIIGGDSPTLPADFLRQGLDFLHDDNDAVLGPSQDGGYYAVGCRRPRSTMFDNVRWSSEHALADTETAFERCGYKVRRLPAWWDVDTPGDLERLRGDAAPGSRVEAWFRRRPPERRS